MPRERLEASRPPLRSLRSLRGGRGAERLSRRTLKSVQFSVPKSVHFSMPIDTCRPSPAGHASQSAATTYARTERSRPRARSPPAANGRRPAAARCVPADRLGGTLSERPRTSLARPSPRASSDEREPACPIAGPLGGEPGRRGLSLHANCREGHRESQQRGHWQSRPYTAIRALRYRCMLRRALITRVRRSDAVGGLVAAPYTSRSVLLGQFDHSDAMLDGSGKE